MPIRPMLPTLFGLLTDYRNSVKVLVCLGLVLLCNDSVDQTHTHHSTKFVAELERRGTQRTWREAT